MLGIFQNFGTGEILLILAVLLLLFGARKLPELARSLGKSTKEFKAGMRDGSTDGDATVSGESRSEKTSE